ncbi:Outer membrane receptor proteins, mostly Fe transport [Salegentibacter echinorum]|uniref:Outer membrane receptor proteins, mostly Fe transport n=1 Tax=Salegentibacter echinorum TaxID=1073325 RepID=A0A1M5K4P4_SALEC|nr:TonB-dependent receptor [Salegentibacter echinorum]SHG47778.1 Outer membrane receptor proteins, mostly Fe transport [Salegentibacter echinorum]
MKLKLLNVISFLIISISTGYAQNTGTLKGQITTNDYQAISLVDISIKGTNKGASTNKKGEFVISNVPAGKHIIEVSTLGYEPITQSIDLKAREKKTLNFILKEAVTQLSGITIKGGGLNKQNSATTVNTINAKKIRKLGIYKPNDIVEEIPGVTVSNYSQGGTASTFSMRGFGSGGHGGDVAVNIDGISLNESEGHADGYADMNVLIPLNIARVNVYKGPSSVLFGNFARGGALSFETRKGGQYQDISLKAGSYETFDFQAALGQPLRLQNDKDIKSNFAVQLFRSKGFTENNENLRGNINGRLAYDISEKTDVALTLKGHASNWDAPGFIPGNSDVPDGDQFYSGDRFKQALNAENDGGKKTFISERLDVNHTLNENLRLLVYGYSVQQNFTRFQKFGIDEGGQQENKNGRDVYSFGTSLNGKNAVGAIDFDWTAGAEYYNEFTNKKSWNTANRVRTETNPSQKRRFRVQSISFFAQGEFDIVNYFRPTIGLRYDRYTGSLKLREPGETPGELSLNEQSHLSPKLGFISTWFNGLDFRFSATNGFTIPSGIIRYDKDTNIDPSEIWQYEVGLNYDALAWLDLDIAGYILNTSSELNEVTPGSGQFINAGKTQRRGIELSAKANPFSRFYFDGSFSYVDTEIKENPNKNLEGNELSGIPNSVTNLNLDYTFKPGIGLRYKFKNIGKYATSVFDSFGPEGGQSFAPAPGRNFMVGMNFNL